LTFYAPACVSIYLSDQAKASGEFLEESVGASQDVNFNEIVKK
jgi:hypothetical protein